MKVYCFDIDDTICQTLNTDYENSIPFKKRIEYINKLYEEGNIIKIFTARGNRSGIDHTKLTVKQLKKWRVQYHELSFGKPWADIYIDDKACNSEQFNWE